MPLLEGIPKSKFPFLPWFHNVLSLEIVVTLRITLNNIMDMRLTYISGNIKIAVREQINLILPTFTLYYFLIEQALHWFNILLYHTDL